MTKNIVIIQGHPDPAGGHFGHALADAYRMGAERAGMQVHTLTIAHLNFSLLRRKEDWREEVMPPDVLTAQASILWADHIVLIYPLWLGSMPALVKGFLENVLCEGFALESGKADEYPKKLLKGKSARIIVTMGMPAVAYRVFYRAHSVKSLERNMLRFCGIRPVRCTFYGGIEGPKEQLIKYLKATETLGTTAA